jgi:hypothetical protein
VAEGPEERQFGGAKRLQNEPLLRTVLLVVMAIFDR